MSTLPNILQSAIQLKQQNQQYDEHSSALTTQALARLEKRKYLEEQLSLLKAINKTQEMERQERLKKHKEEQARKSKKEEPAVVSTATFTITRRT